MDYNSSLPCGKAMVKVENETIIIPCYYLFALLATQSDNIVTLIILDGDFLNYDLELYKESKYSNYTEYNHGPYGEGSVRHRKMYTYPNPLNSHLACFNLHKLLIVKKNLIEKRIERTKPVGQIVRTDKYGNSFYFSILDETDEKMQCNEFETLTGIFDDCKVRKPKERTAYVPVIPKL